MKGETMKQNVIDEVEAILLDVINNDYVRIHEEIVNTNWNEVADEAARLSKHAFAVYKFKKEAVADKTEPF
jgi:hypothetical protein